MNVSLLKFFNRRYLPTRVDSQTLLFYGNMVQVSREKVTACYFKFEKKLGVEIMKHLDRYE